jgi:hypothetical protein
MVAVIAAGLEYLAQPFVVGDVIANEVGRAHFRKILPRDERDVLLDFASEIAG